MDHAHEFSTLGIGQIWAVDNPVMVTATVKADFFPALMANIFPLLSFSPGTGCGLCLIEASLAAAAAAAVADAVNAVANASPAAALPF